MTGPLEEVDPVTPRPVLFGCPVDTLDLEGAVAWTQKRIRDRAPCRIGAVNAAKLVKLEHDPSLAAAVGSCELIVADGMSVVWAARFLTGARVPRVAGIDLMEALLDEAGRRGQRVYFLGAKPEILDRMLVGIARRHPGLVVAGSHHGYFKRDEEPSLVDSIRASRADLLFVGMGTPAKEFWIDRNHRFAGATVTMGVGGSFDVISGAVRRAPRWMQNLGMEWLFRLAQEPRRLWRRYLTTGATFVAKVTLRTLRRPFSRGDA